MLTKHPSAHRLKTKSVIEAIHLLATFAIVRKHRACIKGNQIYITAASKHFTGKLILALSRQPCAPTRIRDAAVASMHDISQCVHTFRTSATVTGIDKYEFLTCEFFQHPAVRMTVDKQ